MENDPDTMLVVGYRYCRRSFECILAILVMMDIYCAHLFCRLRYLVQIDPNKMFAVWLTPQPPILAMCVIYAS
jgi:hypothetical protein